MVPRPRIALDAMGGDRAPTETVAGAVEAAARGVDVVVVGDESVVAKELAALRSDLPVVHAPEVITMDDDPARAIRQKKGASVTVAAQLVADGEAAGMVSAGSTGAAMAAAAFIIGRIPGVQRPAIATIYPIPGGGIVVLDSGANIECRPDHLLQFAEMGTVLSEIYVGKDRPRVGLLNIGEEPGKGRELEKEAYPLLEASAVNFIGNVEGRDLGTSKADVFVTDGFTGNVLLKGAEGTAAFLGHMVTEAILGAGPQSEVAAMAMILGDVRARVNPETYGGAHLVGTKGTVVISHGSSSRVAIANALSMASEGAERRLVERISARIAD